MFHRDPFLKVLITCHCVMVKKTVAYSQSIRHDLKVNKNLPRSFITFSVFDSENNFEQLYSNGINNHRLLQAKFEQYRHNSNFQVNYEDINQFIRDQIPEEAIFNNQILPYYEPHIFELIPIWISCRRK